MIDFKPIALADKAKVYELFKNNEYRSSGLSFANIFSWTSKHKTQLYIDLKEQIVLFRFIDSNEKLCYTMPIGNMNLAHALEMLLADAKENNFLFRIAKVTDKMWQEINNAIPNTFRYIDCRDDYDYLYLTEKLITLPGKKLQSKRNHINRFKAENPDWKYIRITSDTEINECLEMLEEWENNSFSRLHESQQFDYIATRTMLKNFHYFGLKGGAIKVNGKMIAFSFGEPLTKDTFVIHIEKAFEHITGAYAIINQQFALHEATSYTYINREEDLGIENLRKAKMSYQPEIVLQHGIVLLNH
ncbi:MAG: phosphatidylglycerol lysyltransferase domain-containing protein [Lentimicrobiaceae bacterium]|jgi:hypothetical protein|nr:phosphatidylglycerol lysyltransferase domain-containing protein [Lentimicrobiaceae bacterium]